MRLACAEDAAKQGGSACKSALPKVLPGLCKFSELPPAAVPILVAVTRLPDKKDEALRKLQRVAFYLLQVAFGLGAAGTPQPYSAQTGEAGHSSLPLALAAPIWQDAATPAASNHARQRLALRLLAARARASVAEDVPPAGEESAIAEMTRILHQVFAGLAGAQGGKKPAGTSRSGLFGGGSKESTSPAAQTTASLAGGHAATMRSALAAVRVGAAQFPATLAGLCPSGFDGLVSSDPVGVRHALALAAVGAAANPVEAVERVGPLLQETLDRFGSNGTLFMPASIQQTKSPRRSSKTAAAVLTLDDPYARLYLARLAAAVVHSDHFSKAPSRLRAEPFWQALVLLATRDPSDLPALRSASPARGAARAASLVTLRSSAGAEAAGKGLPAFSPTAQAMQRAALAGQAQAQEGRSLGARAWMMILKETLRPTLPPGIASPKKVGGSPTTDRPDNKPSETLISYVVARLRAGLKSRHPPLVCSAARTAAALCEARALAVEVHGAAAQGESFVVKAMDLLLKDLQAVLDGRGDACQRAAAMIAVVWMQLDGRPQLMPPAAMHRHCSSCGGRSPGKPWPPALVQRLLRCLLSRLQTSHALAPWVLRCTVAVAAAAPSSTGPEQLTLVWGSSLQCGPAAANGALHAAFELLEAAPPPLAATAPAEAAAWARLQRVAAWWLGANANLGSGELVWERRPSAQAHDGEPALEVLAAAARRSPAMVAVIGQLQKAMLTGAWQVRVAAAQALGKVAIRSGEPFRLQCYSILRGATAAADSEDSDPMGLASTVMPILRILDACYSSTCVLQQCIAQWGTVPEEWPARHLASLRARHRQLLADICAKVCFVPPAEFLPLGGASRPLVRPAAGVDGAEGGYAQGAGSGSELEGLMGDTSAPGSVLSGLEGSGLEELLDESAPSGTDATPTAGRARNSSDGSSVGAGGSSRGEEYPAGGERGDSEATGRVSYVTMAHIPCEAGELAVEEEEEVWALGLESGGRLRVRNAAGEVGLVPMDKVEVEDAGSLFGSDVECSEGDSDDEMMPTLSAGVSIAELQANAAALRESGTLQASDEQGGEDEQEGEDPEHPGAAAAAATGVLLARRAVGGGRDTDVDAFEFDSPSSRRIDGVDAGAMGAAELPAMDLFGGPNRDVADESTLSSDPGAAVPLVDGDSLEETGDLSFNDLVPEPQAAVRDADQLELAAEQVVAEPPASKELAPAAEEKPTGANLIGAHDHEPSTADTAAAAAHDSTVDDSIAFDSESFPAASSAPEGAVVLDSEPFPATASADSFGVFDPEPVPAPPTAAAWTASMDGFGAFDAEPLPDPAALASAAVTSSEGAAGGSVDAVDSAEPFPAAAASAVSADGFGAFDSEPFPGTPAAAASTVSMDGFGAFDSEPFPSASSASEGVRAFDSEPFSESPSAAAEGFGAFRSEPFPPLAAKPAPAGSKGFDAFGSEEPFPAAAVPTAAAVGASRDVFDSTEPFPGPASMDSAPAGNGTESSWASFGGSPGNGGGGGFDDFFGTTTSAAGAMAAEAPTQSDFGGSLGDHTPPWGDPAAAAAPAAVQGEQPRVAVVHSFTAEAAGEVSVAVGQEVRLAAGGPAAMAGWTRILLDDGSAGVVPSNYLALGGGAPADPLEAVAEYPFTGEADGELSVAAGDRLAVRSEVDGWYEVSRLGDGAVGLVPVSYVRLTPGGSA
eukprot:jgi/Tetstr1/428418/TSEL_018432.t1